MKQELAAVGKYAADEGQDVYAAELKETVADILRRQEPAELWQHVTVEHVDCGPGSRDGDNYMSIVKRVEALCSAKTSDGRNPVFTISLIFKRQLTNLNRRQLFRCDAAFENEITAYNYIIPALQRRTPYLLPYPKCFAADADDRGDRIVMEDLAISGYAMVDRRVCLSFAQCALVMKELGKVHAVSVAMKHLHPLEYADVCSKVREIVFCPEAADFYTHSLETSLRGALDSLRYSNRSGELDAPIKAIEGLAGRLYRIMSGLVCDGVSDSWRVICHGDTWVNNLMFNEDRQHVKLIDLQTLRCTTPVIDILHLLYTSTSRDVRQHHTAELLRQYRRALLETLAEHLHESMNPTPTVTAYLRRFDEQFSYARLRAEYDRCQPYGLGIAMWLLPAVTFSPNQIPDLDEVTINDFKTNKHEKKIAQMVSVEFHTRMRDIALELYEQGVLDRLRDECI